MAKKIGRFPSFEQGIHFIIKALGIENWAKSELIQSTDEISEDSLDKFIKRFFKGQLAQKKGPQKQLTKENLFHFFFFAILEQLSVKPTEIFEEVILNDIRDFIKDYSFVIRNSLTYTTTEDEILYTLLHRFVFPRLSILLSKYCILDEALDKGMPGGKFWYLPHIHKGKIKQPLLNFFDWWFDLITNKKETVEQMYLTMQIASKDSDRIPSQSTFYSWMTGASNPSMQYIDSITRLDFTYEGTYQSKALDHSIQMPYTLEFLYKKGLCSTSLAQEIPMNEKRISTLLENPEFSIKFYPEDWENLFTLLVERYRQPPVQTIKNRFLWARFSQYTHSFLTDKFGEEETYALQALFTWCYNTVLDELTKIRGTYKFKQKDVIKHHTYLEQALNSKSTFDYPIKDWLGPNLDMDSKIDLANDIARDLCFRDYIYKRIPWIDLNKLEKNALEDPKNAVESFRKQTINAYTGYLFGDYPEIDEIISHADPFERAKAITKTFESIPQNLFSFRGAIADQDYQKSKKILKELKVDLLTATDCYLFAKLICDTQEKTAKANEEEFLKFTQLTLNKSKVDLEKFWVFCLRFEFYASLHRKKLHGDLETSQSLLSLLKDFAPFNEDYSYRLNRYQAILYVQTNQWEQALEEYKKALLGSYNRGGDSYESTIIEGLYISAKLEKHFYMFYKAGHMLGIDGINLPEKEALRNHQDGFDSEIRFPFIGYERKLISFDEESLAAVLRLQLDTDFEKSIKIFKQNHDINSVLTNGYKDNILTFWGRNLDKMEEGIIMWHKKLNNVNIINFYASNVKKLIDAGININYTNATGKTALHYFYRYGFYDIANQLTAAGAKVNIMCEQGDVMFHKFCKDVECDMNWFVKSLSADVNQCNGNGDTPLTCSVIGNQFKNVQSLIKHGANINKTENGKGPLYWAVLLVRLDVVSILIENKASYKPCFFYDQAPVDLVAMLLNNFDGHQRLIQNTFGYKIEKYDLNEIDRIIKDRQTHKH